MRKKQVIKKKSETKKSKKPATKAQKAKKPTAQKQSKKKADVKAKPAAKKAEVKKKSDAVSNEMESNARKAVKIAQQSTLDLIRQTAMKINKEKKTKEDDNDNDFMEILTPRRRGRPPKHERARKKDNTVYVPEYDGLQEKVAEDPRSNGNSYANDNETIDFWTDDDIPMAKSWKDDSFDF